MISLQPYIVREINNLIMAGAISKRRDENVEADFGYTSEMLLDYNDVSVMQFKQTGKKIVRVAAIEVDEEGFAVDTIDTAIREQNVRAERLYAQLTDN